MPTKRARIQVLVNDEVEDKIKTLADERGLSVSAMSSQLIHAALRQPEFQPAPDLSLVKSEFVKAAIQGGDISSMKAQKLLELINHLSET